MTDKDHDEASDEIAGEMTTMFRAQVKAITISTPMAIIT